MKLKVVMEGDGKHFYSGSNARIWLNGEDVSRWTTKVVVTVDAEAAIMAEVTFGVSDLELELPAGIDAVLSDDQRARLGRTNTVKR